MCIIPQDIETFLKAAWMCFILFIWKFDFLFYVHEEIGDFFQAKLEFV